MSVIAHHPLSFSHPFICPFMLSLSSNSSNTEVEMGRNHWSESRCWEIRKDKIEALYRRHNEENKSWDRIGGKLPR